ncbi:hypothetical protein C8039_08520 [Halogeometricum sp. wsp3]|nr:hypothetical protein C8039_08520 [Halogeometricum sp. wsp3]
MSLAERIAEYRDSRGTRLRRVPPRNPSVVEYAESAENLSIGRKTGRTSATTLGETAPRHEGESIQAPRLDSLQSHREGGSRETVNPRNTSRRSMPAVSRVPSHEKRASRRRLWLGE